MPEEVATPYITVTKYLSAQLYGDVASARQFIDPVRVFESAGNNPQTADSLLRAQINVVQRFARENRLPSLLAVHRCRVVQQVQGDSATVSFKDKIGPRERIRFTLRKPKGSSDWIIVGYQLNVISALSD